MPKNNTNNINKEPSIKWIKKAEKGDFFAITSSVEKYNLTRIRLLEHLVNKKKFNGIYVSLNKPCLEISDELKKNKININKIYFIDGTSRRILSAKSLPQCTVISGPEALTELSLTIDTIANTKKFDFLIFDSLSTLLIYNKEKTTQKFCQYIINRIKNQKLMGFIISLDDTESIKVISIISQFCDDTIKA